VFKLQFVKLVILLGLTVGASVLLESNPVYAQTQDPASPAANNGGSSGFIPDSYDYEVQPDSNQTLLVRRSLQLYDAADDALALNPAQTVYAETHVVRSMGSRPLIHPGDNLSILAELVGRYARSSQDLSPQALAAWQVYADSARFEISHISPLNVAVNDQGQVIQSGQLQDQTALSTAGPSNSGDEPVDSSWYIWFIAAGTAAVLWYVFWRRVEEPA